MLHNNPQRKRRGIEVGRSRSYVDLETSARRFRKQLGLCPFSPVPSQGFLERLSKVRVLVGKKFYPVEYAIEEPPHGIPGQSSYDPERGCFVVGLRADVYDDFLKGRSRARFTVPHECGHVSEHGPELIKLVHLPEPTAALLRGQVDQHPTFKDSEWQANGWASAFLMPALTLAEIERRCQSLDAEAVAKHFGVSVEAAHYRIQTFLERRKLLLAA